MIPAPKYKKGDVLQWRCFDGTTSILIVRQIIFNGLDDPYHMWSYSDLSGSIREPSVIKK